MPQDLRKASCPHEAAVLAELGQHPITSPPAAGVPRLVVVIVASIGWVGFARGRFPADGTVTYPSAPYWSNWGCDSRDAPVMTDFGSVTAWLRWTAGSWRTGFAMVLSARTR